MNFFALSLIGLLIFIIYLLNKNTQKRLGDSIKLDKSIIRIPNKKQTHIIKKPFNKIEKEIVFIQWNKNIIDKITINPKNTFNVKNNSWESITLSNNITNNRKNNNYTTHYPIFQEQLLSKIVPKLKHCSSINTINSTRTHKHHRKIKNQSHDHSLVPDTYKHTEGYQNTSNLILDQAAYINNDIEQSSWKQFQSGVDNITDIVPARKNYIPGVSPIPSNNNHNEKYFMLR